MCDCSFDILPLLDIGTIGDHDTHSQGEGVEHLAHGSQHSRPGKMAEIWLEVVDKAFPCTWQED